MTSATLTPAALHTALTTGPWPAGWPLPAQVAAALAGYPVAAVAVALEPPALWEEEAQAADPEWPLAPKLLITLDTPASKDRTAALERAFAAHLNQTLQPGHCESTYQGSAWSLDWAAEPADGAAGYYAVEYDPPYYGGCYSRAGETALVPAGRAAAIAVEVAFQEVTGHDPARIVHYDPDARYTAAGTPLD